MEHCLKNNPLYFGQELDMQEFTLSNQMDQQTLVDSPAWAEVCMTE